MQKQTRTAVYDDFLRLEASRLAQGCGTYQEFTARMGETPEEELQYYGVAICGDKRRVNRLTGSLPLLR